MTSDPDWLAKVKRGVAAEERNAILRIIRERSESLQYEDPGSAFDMNSLHREISQRG